MPEPPLAGARGLGPRAVARAVWFERPGVARVRVEPLAAPGPGEALVRTLRSGVSAGTERRVLLGDVPEEVGAAMALPSMRGGFGLPISYGYAAVGVIEEVGPGVPRERRGERVFALHPHHDVFLAPASTLRPLSADVPPERQVLAPSLETAVNVVWDAAI
jgi:NADPH:quinone reductase-like Zn-dependent oxidoreductase